MKYPVQLSFSEFTLEKRVNDDTEKETVLLFSKPEELPWEKMGELFPENEKFKMYHTKDFCGIDKKLGLRLTCAYGEDFKKTGYAEISTIENGMGFHWCSLLPEIHFLTDDAVKLWESAIAQRAPKTERLYEDKAGNVMVDENKPNMDMEEEDLGEEQEF